MKKTLILPSADKAFDYIGDNVGHVYFILAAAGAICYGLFMFILGRAYDHKGLTSLGFC